MLVSYEYLFRQIGYFLVFQQPIHKADLIVVLNGRDTERSLAAVDLFNLGYADLIVLARGPKQPGCEAFQQRVGKDFNSKTFFQRAVEAMAVPENAFRLIGNGVTSIFDEAWVTKKFMSEKGYRSLVLVTSKWHSKRAYLTFNSVLNNKSADIEIMTHPSKYDTFDPETWWKNENHAELVFGEIVRLIYYFLMCRISLLS